MTLPAVHALVAGLVDYAGLFPPASLPMPDAVERYASYRASADAWMLGRFVVPVARLSDLASEAARYASAATSPWRLSALVGDDVDADAQRIRSFNAAHADRFVVDSAELKATSETCIERAARALGSELAVYVELPYDADPRALLEAVSRTGARAKIRTGGVTADAFPTAAQLARFIARCAAMRVPFKATAGLHHPLRGEHPLTYRPDAPTATMFGFLNVFVAGALASAGASEAELVELLEERSAVAFAFTAEGLRWRLHMVTVEQLAQTRASFGLAFGSCSFREPVDDLHDLSLL